MNFLLALFTKYRVRILVVGLAGSVIGQQLYFRAQIKDLEWALSLVAMANQVPPEKSSRTTAFDPFAIAIAPQSDSPADWNVGRAMALLREGEIDLAAEQFNTAIVLEPKSAVAAQGLKLCDELKEEERARRKKRAPSAMTTIFDYAAHRTKKALKQKGTR